jgi:hypothetical protein
MVLWSREKYFGFIKHSETHRTTNYDSGIVQGQQKKPTQISQPTTKDYLNAYLGHFPLH